MIIAIDGPAGSGKSTVAKLVAKKLGFMYVDTGAMYRALTLKAMRSGTNLKDERALINIARRAKIKLNPNAKLRMKVLLDGKDCSGAIRAPQVTSNISFIANVAGVRKEMVKLQRLIGCGAKIGAVLEGRDIGTVVFPNADRKFYLDASVKERARRRHKELAADGIRVSLPQIEEDIKTRDRKDKTRKVGALKKAKDAIVIDTTKLTIERVLETVLSYI